MDVPCVGSPLHTLNRSAHGGFPLMLKLRMSRWPPTIARHTGLGEPTFRRIRDLATAADAPITGARVDHRSLMASCVRSKRVVNDELAVDHLSVVQVFGEQSIAACLQRGSDDELVAELITGALGERETDRHSLAQQ